MRLALERLRRIERHLLGSPTPDEAADWHLQRLLDPELAADAAAQGQLYAALHQAGRRQLRQELEAIHARLHRATGRRTWLQVATDRLRQALNPAPRRGR